MRIKTQVLSLAVGVVSVAGIAMAPLAFAADTTTITARIAKTASVATTSGNVLLNITPTAAGSFTSASDTVTAGTNSTSGYQLQISAATTALTKGSDTIAALAAATPASPATMTVNNWGYRVDGQSGFGSGPTSATTNGASLTGTWAGVTSSPVTFKTTASASSSDSTTVWYGAGADFTKPNGDYVTTVTYTAVAN